MTTRTINIKGAGGGSGSDSHTAVEAPNTLRSRTTARMLFLTSRGEIGGLSDQANPLKAVYFNNTPVMNSDGSSNFVNALVSERYGLPSQSVMSGYPSASNTINLGTKITTTTPVVYTTSVSNIDAVRVTIRFPALFAQASNGDTNGTSVTFRISIALYGGAYSVVKTVTKSDKCISPADVDYLINRPSGSGTWSVKVERITADNSSSTIANDIFFQFATEIQNAQLQYNGYAYYGVTVSAETTGSTYPTVAFDLYGRKIKVPSNYTVSTRTYSGAWDGTFAASKQVCDNPAWVLYDLLTDPDAGMGSIIAESDVDKYSFYDAAVYCDGLVPKASGVGTEPRYTFNYQFMDQLDAWTMIQNVAACFGSVVYTSGNKVRLVQDRPTSPSRLITNSNVIDGNFEYTSSQRSQRSSACLVYWNDPSQNWLSVPAYYEDASGTARYGLNVKQITGLGVTSEGQAQRLAKWTVETSLYNTDAVAFKVGFSNAGMEPGEVIKIMDTNYAMTMNEAKIVSSTSTSITLDRTVTVRAGDTFDVVGSDGVTLYTCTVTNTGATQSLTNAGNSISLLAGSDGTPVWTSSDTTNVISFSGGAISVVAGADVIFSGAVSARPFKVTGVKEDSPGIYTVSAVLYDANKFGRVDSTPTGLTPVYQAQPLMTVVSPVTSITFSEESYTDVDGTAKRNLIAKWTPVSGQFVTKYKVFWSKDGNTIASQDLVQPNSRLSIDTDGLYAVTIYASNARGTTSSAATGSYAVALSAPSAGSAFSPVTTLIVKGVGGSSFTGTDCSVVWSDPNTNGGSVVAGYRVQVLDAATPTTVYRTEFVKTAAYTYDITKQQADNGSSFKRSFIISVQVKDTWGRLSTATAVTFSNPAPATVTGIAVVGSFKSNFVTWAASTESDVKGYLVWRGTTSGFSPSSGNLILDGNVTSMVDSGLSDSTTYYYKIAAYDTFGKDYGGSGLNVGASSAVTTLNASIQNEYQLNGVTWTPNSPGANQIAWTTCTAIKTQGVGIGNTWAVSSGNATWTSGILYIYYVEGNTALSTTTNLSAAVASNAVIVATYRGGTNFEFGNGKAYTDGSYVLAGTVGASQLVTGTAVITQSAQIASAIVGTTQIANAAITNAQLGTAAVQSANIGNAQVGTLQIAGSAVFVPVLAQVGATQGYESYCTTSSYERTIVSATVTGISDTATAAIQVTPRTYSFSAMSAPGCTGGSINPPAVTDLEIMSGFAFNYTAGQYMNAYLDIRVNGTTVSTFAWAQNGVYSTTTAQAIFRAFSTVISLGAGSSTVALVLRMDRGGGDFRPVWRICPVDLLVMAAKR